MLSKWLVAISTLGAGQGALATAPHSFKSAENSKPACIMHIYAHAHRSVMTKVISLSEKAYETLKGLKKSGESFSDVVLRVASKEHKRSVLEFAGTWKGDDIDEVFAIVLKDREQAKARDVEL